MCDCRQSVMRSHYIHFISKKIHRIRSTIHIKYMWIRIKKPWNNSNYILLFECVFEGIIEHAHRQRNILHCIAIGINDIKPCAYWFIVWWYSLLLRKCVCVCVRVVVHILYRFYLNLQIFTITTQTDLAREWKKKQNKIASHNMQIVHGNWNKQTC